MEIRLDEFIGQNIIVSDLLERIKIANKSGKQLPPMLICAPPEMGKRTLAYAAVKLLFSEILKSKNPPQTHAQSIPKNRHGTVTVP